MAGNFKKIFAGIFLLWSVLVIFAAAFYWPQIKESFLALTGRGLPAGRQAAVPLAPAGGGNLREGFLWVDPAASSPLRGPNGQREPIGQYIVTLGEIQGALPGKNLVVYDGSDELGEVTVERALEAVSYVRPAKASLDLSQNPGGYYRVVMK